MIAEFIECLSQHYAEDFTVIGSFMSSSQLWGLHLAEDTENRG